MRLRYRHKNAWVFTLPSDRLFGRVAAELVREHGYRRLVRGREFLYAPGKTPVLVVAHVDTVHAKPPREVLYDPRQEMLWSPEGIGADDRAGVLGILWLLRLGKRPYVLLLDGEERGCTGAWEAVKVLDVPEVKYIVELDRKSGSEAVFYQCTNKDFEQYILSYGFTRSEGTFTDITTLCPAWKLAGANLSCGYYNAHTREEYLKIGELRHTVQRLLRMLDAPPAEAFVYESNSRYTYGLGKSDRFSQRYYGYGLDIALRVCPEDLVDMYGGTEDAWDDWLAAQSDTLYYAAEGAVWDAIGRAVEHAHSYV